MTCSFCHAIGHTIKKCPQKHQPEDLFAPDSGSTVSLNTNKCKKCQQPGHKKRTFPVFGTEASFAPASKSAIYGTAPGQVPNKHLKEFHIVCNSMRPTTVSEEHIKLKAFPFSLKHEAKDWLFDLPSSSITT
ncbi:hypothetical protein ACH5RR_006555 [Cinchona calisaya]|uniref:CCHC-type domain-containing protein n=1 Tax=Cinchona calisaya TaxID=153742 RepID=A0ABD3APD4_9GENT